MTVVLNFKNRTVSIEEIIPLLSSYQMLPKLMLELIIDEAISSIECIPEEIERNYQQFCLQNQLVTENKLQAWLSCYGMNSHQLKALATRKLKIEKFKQIRWADKVKPYFNRYKSKFDQVVYSQILVQDIGLAQELYFRLIEREESFFQIAQKYSQVSEPKNGGLVGPIKLNDCHPNLARILRISQPGILLPPFRIEKYVVIIRLEKFISAQLDEPICRQLLNEFFTNWLTEQVTCLMQSSN